MIILYINGSLHHLPKDACETVASLLDYLLTTTPSAESSPDSHSLPALPKGPFGVAVNQTFVSKSLYAQTRLHANDRLELVIPMQGG